MPVKKRTTRTTSRKPTKRRVTSKKVAPKRKPATKPASKKKPAKKPRNYKKEYKYHSSPKQKKRRAGRNKSRRLAKEAGKIKKGSKLDIHHIDNDPTNTRLSNLRPETKKKNRSRKTK
ncbi:MAG: hypothetical protein GY928_33880 [Colwellia sp.]|nr:hypothetical protein [Colwellia sp.]